MSSRSWTGIIRAKLQQGLYAGEGTVHFLPLCIMDGSQAPWSCSNSHHVPGCSAPGEVRQWREEVSKKVPVPHMTPAGLMENKHQMLNGMGLSFLMLFLNFLPFDQDIWKSPQRVERDIFGEEHLQGTHLSR